MYLYELSLTILAVIASASCMAMVNRITFLPRQSHGHLGENNDIERQAFVQNSDPSSFPMHDARPNLDKRFESWTKIDLNPVNGIEAPVGSRIELECVANGSPTPEILWFTGTGPTDVLERELKQYVQEQYVPSTEWKGLGRVVSKLVIDCLTPADAGLIYCASVSNLETQMSSPTMLVVNGDHSNNCSTESEPTITFYSSTRVAHTGSTVVLPCQATGKPMPQISWLDNYNRPITHESHSNVRVLDNGDLLIEDLSWSHMGEYTCKATSGHNEQQVGSFIYPLALEKETDQPSNDRTSRD